MGIKNPEITIGQMYRALTHVRQFKKAVGSPEQAQIKKLMQIVRANETSAFGKKHKFERIRSVKEYQSLVPPCNYEDLQPYIQAAMEGSARQLTAETPFMYATTSGTTAAPKLIPITNSHLRDYTRAFQVHNYQMIEDYPRGAEGRFLIISSNDEEGQVPSGAPYGAVSGLLNRRQPAVIKKYFALPYELCKIKDVEAKYYLMLRVAAPQGVTAILCCNPSSLMLMADQLCEHAGDLIADIYDGTIKKSYLPPHLREALKRYQHPDRVRARELDCILEKEGKLLPKHVWPDLALISCWKGGPMGFYLDRLPELYGDLPIRDFGYMASEGRGSIPLSNEGAAGVLALTSHFFEFVPEEEADSPAKRFLTAEELELDRRYYIYFTTASGLFRYNINDLIEVVGFHERTPVIQFVRKGAGISSITGEKLTEEQVRVALCLAVRQLKLTELSHFTAAVELGNPPHYVCYAELRANLSEPVRKEFLRIFEQSLQAQNPEYLDKRATRRLGAPRLEGLPPGTYARLRQQRVLEGAPEAQVKIPLLSSIGDFGGRLALLDSSAREAVV